MANAGIDQNTRASLTALSNVDGTTIVVLWADPVTHRLLVDVSSGLPSFADGETPSGTINGNPETGAGNKTFTLAHTPNPAASLQLFLDGVLMAPVGVDFTLSTATITFNSAPPTGATLLCWYRY